MQRALQVLGELDFIPLESFRVARCTERAARLPPHVAELLGPVLLAGAHALAAVRRAPQLKALVTFAGSLPQRVGHALFQELIRTYDSLV